MVDIPPKIRPPSTCAIVTIGKTTEISQCETIDITVRAIGSLAALLVHLLN